MTKRGRHDVHNTDFAERMTTCSDDSVHEGIQAHRTDIIGRVCLFRAGGKDFLQLAYQCRSADACSLCAAP